MAPARAEMAMERRAWMLDIDDPLVLPMCRRAGSKGSKAMRKI